MTVEVKLLSAEQKITNKGNEFVVIYFQEVDDSGKAFGKPYEVTSFDSSIVEQSKSLVPENFYRFDLTIKQAYLTSISHD